MATPARRAMLAALVCGLAAVLSQSPVSVPWILALAIPGIFILWARASTPRRAFAIGWAAGVGYFGAGLHWIAEPFLVDAATFGWMIPFALLGISTGLALFWGVGFWLAKRMGGDGWATPFAFAAGWLALEWLRGNILTGFPWLLIGYAWVETPAIQSAALVGIYGVTLWTVLAGALLGNVLVAHGGSRIMSAVSGVAIVASAFIYGVGSLADRPSYAENAPMVGLVQPNVAQEDKWQPALREAHLADLLAKTRELSDKGADVVIWPEAATPYPITHAPRLRQQMAETLKPGGVLLAGGLRFENPGSATQRVFNSLVAIGKNGDVITAYDKQHLVPFGEFLPFDDWLTQLGVRAMAALPGGMSFGESDGRRMPVPGLPPFVPMICYEAIFPAEIMSRDEARDWMVQVTNDAWFGEIAGPYQHLDQARVRAIERGLPLARAANTGVSAMIDGNGRILDGLPLNKSGVLLHRLPNAEPVTPYTHYEDSLFGVALLFCLLIGWLGNRKLGV